MRKPFVVLAKAATLILVVVAAIHVLDPRMDPKEKEEWIVIPGFLIGVSWVMAWVTDKLSQKLWRSFG